ncbi:hypothetical protein VB735_34285 [Halotia wernerae UHCC 0503]|nr:hypothetical protein [Halotia wernerae UHCC 0503]
MASNKSKKCCDDAQLPSKELTEKMCQLDTLHAELTREFTNILNAKGITGSVLEFSVYDRDFDDVMSSGEQLQGIFGCWTCPPDCVCCGIRGRFLAPS